MSMLYLAISWCFKFKSIVKDDRILAADQDVWNDKDRDDALHFYKYEYFLYTFLLTQIASEFVISFLKVYKIGYYDKPHEPRFKWFPDEDADPLEYKRPLMPIQMILCMCMFCNICHLVAFSKLLKRHDKTHQEFVR